MEITGAPKLLGCSWEDDELQGVEKIASNITQLVGWAPLVELYQIMERDGLNSRLVGKIDFFQPLSSIKDRIALRMIEDAEEKSLITPEVTTLLAATSGNFGIGMTFISIHLFRKAINLLQSCRKIIHLRNNLC